MNLSIVYEYNFANPNKKAHEIIIIIPNVILHYLPLHHQVFAKAVLPSRPQ